MKKPKKINFFAIGKKVISNEIDALQEVSSGISKNEFNNVCNFLLETKGNLIFLGIGKSGKVSEKISATLSSLGKPSFYINAAEASHGDLGAITKKDSLIIFSYSGETEELVDLLPNLKQKKVNICSVTGNKNSSIALSSKAHITLNLKKEADMLNLAPTSSTTAMMMVGDAISVAITNHEGLKRSDFGANHPGGSLGKSFIKVREIMIKEKDLPFIDGNISIIDAMEKISKKGFGLGLIKIKGIVKGIFTDGDLRRMINNRIDLTSTPIKEVMTKNFKFVEDVDLVLDVSRIMEDQKIYSLIVKNSNKKITGLIRMHEILSAKII
ncbi:KpsF/GutQ family sugar-phosphate isomerase [Gammaproteobacteria bacterium]|nr:KpsF/GutQ family sugar-phosphate isomerase [Gammaproteobacteria bacterium]